LRGEVSRFAIFNLSDANSLQIYGIPVLSARAGG